MIIQRTATPIASGSVPASSCEEALGRPRGNSSDNIATRTDSTTKNSLKRTP